ncbi:MAG TPA: hypothetical protein VMZ28_07720 [Kofleriaceae bacterium]|nr:hypothetical protein [Kofleriaceae bacterium]
MAQATFDHLGLSHTDHRAGPPARWTPETLDVALRRLRALGGAQIRLLAADGLTPAGKDAVLCGAERTVGGGELMVEHVEWQVAHLHVLHAGDLFQRALDAMIAMDFVGPAPEAPRLRAQLDSGWPAVATVELVSCDGAISRRAIDARQDDAAGALLRLLMEGIDEHMRDAVPFLSRGPTPVHGIAACFAHALGRALLATLRDRHDDPFHQALRRAAEGDLSARDELARPWPPTSSGVEVAQAHTALYLVGVAHRDDDRFPWHRAPGQPGAELRRLLHHARLAASVVSR